MSLVMTPSRWNARGHNSHMPKPADSSRDDSRGKGGLPTPWGYARRVMDERYQRQRRELREYLEQATPIALLADRLYWEWREVVEEPIQDGQKAANRSANYWWQVTERLRAFQKVQPPGTAARYHKLFLEALTNASQGAVSVKNGFRYTAYTEVSRGIAFLDRYVELMAEAEKELGRLVRKYRLIEEPDASG